MADGVKEGFRTVRHALLEREDAATLYVAGRADAPHLVFFCAGFPCDHTSFLPLASRLAAAGCLVGVSCMPEFDREQPLRPQGYDLEQMNACFAQAVAALEAQAASRPRPPLTLVVHDWGVIPGFCYANAAGCDKLVAFDVLPGPPDRLYYKLVHTNYQSMFAIAFALSRLLPWLGRLWLNAGAFINFFLLRRFLNPVGPRTDGRLWNPCASVGFMPWQQPDTAMSGALAMTPYRCYPYFHVLKLLFKRGAMKEVAKKISLKRSLEKQPICFIYGEEKNTHFHSEAALQLLRSKDGCEAIGVPRAGHWCYKHEPELCYQAVKRFIMGSS